MEVVIKNRIAIFRKEKGLSQHRLAKAVGLKRRSIMAYENNIISPTLETAYKISLVLGSDIIKLFINTLYYATDSSRQFIVYFSPKGIYEKELGTPLKSDFVLMPWHEIEELSLKPWWTYKVIRFLHLGKNMGYDVRFWGRVNKDNKANLENLVAKNWRRDL